jgi:hypothetical protein
MTDVFLVKTRQPTRRSLERVRLAHVPVGHEILSVGVGGNEQDYVVTQEAQGFRIVAAHQLVGHLYQLLCAKHFRRVQASVNPHHCLSPRGKRSRRGVGEILGERELPSNALVLAKAPVILRRCDDGHPHWAALRTGANALELHPLRLLIELLPVVDHPGVVHQEIVVADVTTELFEGRRDARRRRRGRGDPARLSGGRSPARSGRGRSPPLREQAIRGRRGTREEGDRQQYVKREFLHRVRGWTVQRGQRDRSV